MDLESYAKAMAELGISRAGFETDAEIDGTPSGSQIMTTKSPNLLKPRSSTVPDKRPIEEVPAHLQCVHPQNKTASAWWSKMSPQERAEAVKQRSDNAKKQGRKHLTTQ